jgi:hypothetical protein
MAHSHAGQNTFTIIDFVKPGGTFISSRLMSPRVTASRCRAMVSIAGPVSNSTPGSMACQPNRMKSSRLVSQNAFSYARGLARKSSSCC